MRKLEGRKDGNPLDTEEKIEKYGAEILRSEKFKQASQQKHHFVSTVGDHSLDVARTALEIAEKLEKTGISVDEEKLVKISLCHDFGILGRFEGKFTSRYDCCHRHPKESAKEYQEIYPEADKKEIHAISRHMWPATILPPDSIEGWILTISDKICGIEEGGRFKKGKLWADENRTLLELLETVNTMPTVFVREN